MCLFSFVYAHTECLCVRVCVRGYLYMRTSVSGLCRYCSPRRVELAWRVFTSDVSSGFPTHGPFKPQLHTHPPCPFEPQPETHSGPLNPSHTYLTVSTHTFTPQLTMRSRVSPLTTARANVGLRTQGYYRGANCRIYSSLRSPKKGCVTNDCVKAQ